MKNIEKLIERIKGNKTALVVPKELFDMAIDYFNDDYFTEFVHDADNDAETEIAVDYFDDFNKADYSSVGWYKSSNYKLITLTKEDFEDITENEDNRTFILMLHNRPVINSQSNTIYFNEEEYNQYLDTLDNLRDVIIIPTYGKHFERTAHISFY